MSEAESTEVRATRPYDDTGGVRWLKPWMLVVLVMLFIAGTRIRLLQTPLERDEGEYAYAAQLMLQGVPPYQLAFNMKFPGTYAAYAAIMGLFGQTIAGIHFGLLLLNAVTIWLVYRVGRRLFSETAGVSAAAAFGLLSLGSGVLGSQAHATHFVVAAAMAGTLILLRALDGGRSSSFFWSGVLFGIAILMKQHAVAFAALVLLFLTVFRPQRPAVRISLFCAGVIAPIAATCIALWWAGVFGRFWFWTVTYAKTYATATRLSTGILDFTTVFPQVVGPYVGIWILALAGLVLVWCRSGSKRSALFVAGLLFFSFLAVCPGLYFREHYFVLMLPAVALLAGAAVGITSEMLPPRTWWHLGIFLAALAYPIAAQSAYLFTMTPLEVSREMYGDNPFPEAIEVASYIRSHSKPDARIAVLGSEPEIPFYARRRSATGFMYTYEMMRPLPSSDSMQGEMIGDIEAAKPEYIVFVSVWTSWLGEPNSPQEILTWSADYIRNHYELVGVVDIREGRTEYQWDDAARNAPVKSESNLRVFRRKDRP